MCEQGQARRIDVVTRILKANDRLAEVNRRRFAAAGVYEVQITVTDDGIPNLAATDGLTWTVTNTNRPREAADDAVLLPFDSISTVFSVPTNDGDPDGDPISLTASDPTTKGSTVITVRSPLMPSLMTPVTSSRNSAQAPHVV